jgi:ribose/xylose/arabinose/galactoside ABC-type transport system permease subunit
MSSDLTSRSSTASRPRFTILLPSDPTITMLGALVVGAVIVFGALAPSRFLSGDTLRAIAFQMPELGILSLAMMVPLMSGGLNLAIIATANLSALVTAAILTHLIQPSTPQPIIAAVVVLALLSGMLTSIVIGFLTGVIVAFFAVHPILVTLGIMTLVKGSAVLATSGTVIGGFPPAILFLGNGALFGIPVSMVVFGVCAAVVGVILSYSPFGVSIRLIGSNEKATRYSGCRDGMGACWCVRPLKSAVLDSRARNDGPIQFGKRWVCRVVSPDHDSGGGPGRCRSIRRLWPRSWAFSFASPPSGNLDRL